MKSSGIWLGLFYLLTLGSEPANADLRNGLEVLKTAISLKWVNSNRVMNNAQGFKYQFAVIEMQAESGIRKTDFQEQERSRLAIKRALSNVRLNFELNQEFLGVQLPESVAGMLLPEMKDLGQRLRAAESMLPDLETTKGPKTRLRAFRRLKALAGKAQQTVDQILSEIRS